MDDVLPWVEKYRPRSLAEVIGNGPAISTLKKWALSWENAIPDKRAVVLSGKPGLGKTSAAHALAAELGWGVLELNASDDRNEEVIRRVAGAGAINETFRDDGAFIRASAGGRKLIILDEADNVFGREDRGGIPAIMSMIRETRQPVVLIVNDYYALSRRASTIRGLALEIKFQALRSNQVEKVLRTIAAAEKVEVAPPVITKIAQEAGGDLRAAINDLESVARGRKSVPATAADTLGGRDDRQTAYGMVMEILHTLDLQTARRAMWELDESPDFALLWIEENVPVEYKRPADLDRAFYYLSRADAFLGRTVRRQAFGLWSYATDLMGPGVALAKSERPLGWSRYAFPSWLLKMGRSKEVRRRRQETFTKLGAFLHTSRREIAASVSPFLPALLNQDFELAVRVTAGAELDAEDVGYLLGKGVDSKEIQAVVGQARRLLESGVSLGASAEGRRGARGGTLTLAAAAEAVEAAASSKKGKKAAKGRGAKEEADLEPGPDEDDEKPDHSESAEGSPDAPPQKSLFEY